MTEVFSTLLSILDARPDNDVVGSSRPVERLRRPAPPAARSSIAGRTDVTG